MMAYQIELHSDDYHTHQSQIKFEVTFYSVLLFNRFHTDDFIGSYFLGRKVIVVCCDTYRLSG